MTPQYERLRILEARVHELESELADTRTVRDKILSIAELLAQELTEVLAKQEKRP